MIENRIAIIQSTIQTAGNIPSETTAELLKLFAGLKAEIKTLSETHLEEASSIASFCRCVRARGFTLAEEPSARRDSLARATCFYPRD